MKIIFRADASIAMGSGHAMRCLTLAGALREKGAEAVFICREHSGNISAFIEEKGFRVIRLALPAHTAPQDDQYARWLGVDIETDAAESIAAIEKEGRARWLVNDSYAIDKRWESRLRPHVDAIMAIDDLANREHDCDILLDQNLYDGMDERYNAKVPVHCKRLLGPGFALLRPDFVKAAKELKRGHGHVTRIFVFYGGADPMDETSKALRALQSLNMPEVAVDVVVGNANPNREEVERHCHALPNAAFYCQTDAMAVLMARADIAVGAGGSATWERCCMGVPSVVTVIADNQAEAAGCLERRGAVLNLGWHGAVKEDDIAGALRRLINDAAQRKEMSQRCMALVDGRGAQRVAGLLIGQ